MTDTNLADALLRIKEWNARDDNPDEISGDDLDAVCDALDRTLAAVKVFANPAELLLRLQESGARISHDTACRIIEDDRFGLQELAMKARDAKPPTTPPDGLTDEEAWMVGAEVRALGDTTARHMGRVAFAALPDRFRGGM